MTPSEVATALRAAMRRIAPSYGVGEPLGPEWSNAALLAAACASALAPMYAEVGKLNAQVREMQPRRRRSRSRASHFARALDRAQRGE